MDKKDVIRLSLVSVLIGLMSQLMWWILLYQILVRVEATEFMWFLYWIAIPFYLFTSAISKQVAKSYEKWTKETLI